MRTILPTYVVLALSVYVAGCDEAADPTTSTPMEFDFSSPTVVRAPHSMIEERERVVIPGVRVSAGGCATSSSLTLGPGDELVEQVLAYDAANCTFLLGRGALPDDWEDKREVQESRLIAPNALPQGLMMSDYSYSSQSCSRSQASGYETASQEIWYYERMSPDIRQVASYMDVGWDYGAPCIPYSVARFQSFGALVGEWELQTHAGPLYNYTGSSLTWRGVTEYWGLGPASSTCHSSFGLEISIAPNDVTVINDGTATFNASYWVAGQGAWCYVAVRRLIVGNSVTETIEG